jgi:hypothetical protein
LERIVHRIRPGPVLQSPTRGQFQIAHCLSEPRQPPTLLFFQPPRTPIVFHPRRSFCTHVHQFLPALIRCEHRREGKAHLISPLIAPLSLPPPRLQLHSWMPSSCIGAVPRRALRGPSSPVSLWFPSVMGTLLMATPSGHSPQSPPMPPAPPRRALPADPSTDTIDRRPVTDGSSSPSRTVMEDPIPVSNFLPNASNWVPHLESTL